MKKVILWNLLILLPFCVEAQRQTEYNRKGDEAMARKDYQDALMWYEEGVSYCDPYSINQLTAIWQMDEILHVSMEPVMNKCLNCLNSSAVSKDSLAIKKLILFYTEGIGTSQNEVFVNYWREQLAQLRTPSYAGELFRPKKPKEKMKFFAGYSFSPVAPYGIQVGGVGTIGWYLRARSNLSFSFQPDAPECETGTDGKGHIPSFDIDGEMYHFLPGTADLSKGKESMLIGTVGMVFKVVPNVYLSAGIGYAKYDLIYEYEKINKATGESMPDTRGWTRHMDSYEGVAVDLDVTGVFGKRFYGTVGCSALNFKYIYPSIGVGVFLNLK
jgi:hypothetical protein